MIYEYLILNEHGSVVYADTDKHHTKQLADVLTMRTGKPHFVDIMLANSTGMCDYQPLPKTIDVPDRRDSL